MERSLDSILNFITSLRDLGATDVEVGDVRVAFGSSSYSLAAEPEAEPEPETDPEEDLTDEQRENLRTYWSADI